MVLFLLDHVACVYLCYVLPVSVVEMMPSLVKKCAVVCASVTIFVLLIGTFTRHWLSSAVKSKSVRTNELDESTLSHEDMDSKNMKLETLVSGIANIARTEPELSDDDIGKIQQARVRKFCEEYYQEVDYAVDLGGQVLTDDKRKIAYCFAPKVGCTNLRVAFLRAQGLLPSDVIEVDEKLPLQDAFHIPAKYSVLFAHTLSHASIRRRKLVYESYYKFVMYRNPVERLLSGYRSKIEGYPLSNSNDNIPYKEDTRPEIVKFLHPEKYKQWKASHSKEVIHIKFSEFIEHWLYLMNTNGIVERHFLPIYKHCQPCQVRYDYYGNFKNFNHDAGILLKHQGSNLTLLEQSYYKESEKTTREIAPEYYRQLSDTQKQRILNSLALELKFYYNLFPEEEDSHKIIMDTDYEVPENFSLSQT